MKKKTKAPAKTPKVKKQSVVISMLLDESGSMTHLLDSTISGYNEYLDTLRTDLAKDDVHFSVIKFNSNGITKLQIGAAIKDAIRLDTENYVPRDMTPLHDAIGRTIQATDEVAGKNKADKIIVVIQTDGAENHSTEFNLQKIKHMIEERQGHGWEFVFIGAGINAFATGTQMGIAAMNTMSYGNDAHSTSVMFGESAKNSVNYARGLTGTMAYTSAQSKAAGESPAILRAKMQAKK